METSNCYENDYQVTCLFKTLFSGPDYAVFSCMLIVSALVGIYFAYQSRRKTENVNDYLMAGRSMHFFPTSLSIMCTALSAITILGTPAEFYNYGSMYIWSIAGYFMAISFSNEIFIPVFYKLGINTTYEYLELRFGRKVRNATTIMFMVANVISTGVVIYAPATAISAVTGMSLDLAILTTGLVCIFYTTLGGMKAVVWTDVVQSLWMLTGLMAVIIFTHIKVGYGKIFEMANLTGRTEFFRSSWDPTVRDSLQAYLIGKFFGIEGYAFGCSQNFVQRFLSCKSLAHAKTAGYMAIGWLSIILMSCLFTGYTLVYYYELCDPAAAGFLESTDQLMPFLTNFLFVEYPGLSAIYISGAFAGSLSSVSSFISSMANVIMTDMIGERASKLGKVKQVILAKSLTLFVGFVCIGFAYLSTLLKGGVIEVVLSIGAIIAGPVYAVFMMGVFFPLIEEISALVGLLCGVAACTWCYIGRNIYPVPTEIVEKSFRIPVNTDRCTFENGTSYPIEINESEFVENSGILSFYNISYHYIGTLGFTVTVAASFLTALIVMGRRRFHHTKQQRDARLHCFVFSDIAKKCGYKRSLDFWHRSDSDDDLHEKIIDEEKKEEAFSTDF
ncbi:Oidioi.mRNA.OKI2018_I69.PAR.g8898.t1.cds [Oikopleura dioica]|uniref:Oidioi.mRNA.OKI2018_I69.PAR.g8898.t1.cds n=1 Tax=Oikopleura dioica TaxID=34765 RepID=A0ABN7RKP8_OIKDI|nr:Oidioi.mRNA.OKI2018_I69.PAR.g8898.t1.cds [Oikopleura dioica]